MQAENQTTNQPDKQIVGITVPTNQPTNQIIAIFVVCEYLLS
jgi:hypothetical protein